MKKVSFLFLVLLCVAPLFVSAQAVGNSDKLKENKKCTVESLSEIRTIQVGQNRTRLLKLFTYQENLRGSLNRTFVYRKCPYIKVDVQFDAFVTTKRYAEGRERLVTVNEDKITAISKPYLEFSLVD